MKFGQLTGDEGMSGSLPTRGAWIEITDLLEQRRFFKSRSPHGERGLKSLHGFIPRHDGCCRSPHGERGLKFFIFYHLGKLTLSLPTRGAWIEIPSGGWSIGTIASLPTRGAWIEIAVHGAEVAVALRRSPHGERGLKFRDHRDKHHHLRRSPHGERGLKSSNLRFKQASALVSLPTRGAWIEIAGCNCCFGGCSGRSPHGERGLKYADARYWTCTPGRSPHGERGLKSYNAIRDEKVIRSLPTRGAWIEIRITMSMYPRLIVAPHTGSVD